MAYGKSGYQELVARCCALAQQLAGGIEQSPHFDLLAQIPLNIVCFALRGADTARRDDLKQLVTPFREKARLNEQEAGIRRTVFKNQERF